jgi:hypothetical protein
VVPLGDHWLVAGLVMDTRAGAGGPLLHHDRRNGGFTESENLR